jgi:hypothetical protein
LTDDGEEQGMLDGNLQKEEHYSVLKIIIIIIIIIVITTTTSNRHHSPSQSPRLQAPTSLPAQRPPLSPSPF